MQGEGTHDKGWSWAMRGTYLGVARGREEGERERRVLFVERGVWAYTHTNLGNCSSTTHDGDDDGDDDDDDGGAGVGGRGWEKRRKGGVTDDLWGFITRASVEALFKRRVSASGDSRGSVSVQPASQFSPH